MTSDCGVSYSRTEKPLGTTIVYTSFVTGSQLDLQNHVIFQLSKPYHYKLFHQLHSNESEFDSIPHFPQTYLLSKF